MKFEFSVGRQKLVGDYLGVIAEGQNASPHMILVFKPTGFVYSVPIGEVILVDEKISVPLPTEQLLADTLGISEPTPPKSTKRKAKAP